MALDRLNPISLKRGGIFLFLGPSSITGGVDIGDFEVEAFVES
jgi:hypothetical protein